MLFKILQGRGSDQWISLVFKWLKVVQLPNVQYSSQSEYLTVQMLAYLSSELDCYSDGKYVNLKGLSLSTEFQFYNT